MTLRKTEMIEWSKTPAELRRIAKVLKTTYNMRCYESIVRINDGSLELLIVFSESKWLAEQAEGKE